MGQSYKHENISLGNLRPSVVDTDLYLGFAAWTVKVQEAPMVQ